MPYEIERKFLVERNTELAVLLEGLVGTRMAQAYLAKGAVVVRTRVAGERAWLTLKSAPLDREGRVCNEWEYEIPLAEAQAMMSQPGAYGLEKIRYEVNHQGKTYEVDEYLGSLSGLFTAEVELDDAQEVLQLPDWVGEEVTGQLAWSNEALARNGMPPTV